MTSRKLPKVSFIVACYNALPYLDEAVRSALAQQGVDVEVIIVDDGSRDGSLTHARLLERSDGRVKVLQTATNLGPGGARNVGIQAMTGDWLAVLDSDDIIEPFRSSRLIEVADRCGLDMVADDLIIFGEAGIAAQAHIGIDRAGEVEIVDIKSYFKNSCLFSRLPAYGFLKPMIRRDTLQKLNIRYDESLRIGEDDALVVDLLAKGARYGLVEEGMYHYRKHEASISHRLSLADVKKMARAEDRIRERIGSASASEEYLGRWRALQNGVAFTRSIESLKAGQFLEFFQALLSEPGAILLYRMPIAAKLQKLLKRR